MLLTWAILLATGIAGFLGGLASISVNRGATVWVYYLVGLAPMLTWAWMAKQSPWPLLTSSMAWDIVYNAAFLITIATMAGDQVTAKQYIGIAFFLVGIVLVSG
jgi:hypothetical protein